MSNKPSTRRRGPVPPRPGHRKKQGPPILVLVVIAAVVVAGLAALVMTGETTSDAAEATVAAAEVDGVALTPLPEAGIDPALGQAAPVITGDDFDGEPIVAPTPGRPTILLFVAHWCPHCQAEVPEVRDWLDDGGLPDDMDLVTVSTGIDSSFPNYPPSDWLEDEGWSAPTFSDLDDVVGTAYGLPSFPYWTVVDAEGNVVLRRAGRLSTADLDTMVALARGE